MIMNDANLFWWISLLGSIASLVGFPIAIWQLWRIKNSSEAAEDASIQTKNYITDNLLVSDTSNTLRYLNDVKHYVQNKNYAFAQFRINDVIAQIIQNQAMRKKLDETPKAVVFKLRIIRKHLLEKVADASDKTINDGKILLELSEITDNLNELIGKVKDFQR